MRQRQPGLLRACTAPAAHPCPTAARTAQVLPEPSPACCRVQLLSNTRLPLVFDLDETLLVAKSQSQMAKELRALRDVR